MDSINVYFILIFKTIILYFYIIFVYRLMGKKELGQLSITDLICSLLIAELAALSIANHESSIFTSIIPILMIVFLQIGVSHVTLKSAKIRKLLDGKPTIIIKRGKLLFDEMRKQRYSIEDLIMQMRERGFRSIEEIDYAVLETNGKLSVFNNSSIKKEGNYPLPLIVDGVLDYDVLKNNRKNIDWIDDILAKEQIALREVFYAFFTKDKLFIIKNAKK